MTEPKIDVWEKGNMVWVLVISIASMGWSVQPALVCNVITHEIFLDGAPRTWDTPWYKTEEEAEAALQVKLDSMKLNLNDLVTVQPMTGPSAAIFYMDYEYTSGKKNESDE